MSKQILKMPRLLISGARRGVGVSTIMLGLIVALRKQGVSVGAAKVGASFAEPTHFRRVLGRLAYSLDPWILDKSQLLASLARLSGGSELALFEGSSGLFDALHPEASAANEAAFAALVGAPIILVVEASGGYESVAASVSGFCNFSPSVHVAGIIANHIENDAHNARIKAAIEALNGPVYLGGVRIGDPHQTGGTLAGIHIHNPSALTRNRVVGTGQLIEDSINLEALQRCAEHARDIEVPLVQVDTAQRVVKIAVADDQAFHLTAQDNLDLLRRSGAELVAFSPIADKRLPTDIAGIYFPSGYVHLYANDLASNSAILNAVRQFGEDGGVIYAEGAALAFLARRIVQFNGNSANMVGLLPAVASVLTEDSLPAAYDFEEFYLVKDSVISPPGSRIRGLREGRWSFRFDSAVDFAAKVTMRGHSPSEVEADEGYLPAPNMFFSRANLHWGSNSAVANHFVMSAQRYAASRRGQ